VVLVLPARDEAARIGAVIDRLPAEVLGHPTRCLVVDDGSTDDTVEVARSRGAIVVKHGSSRGLGAAVRTGLRAAVGLDPAAVAFCDADGEYDPAALADLVAPLAAGRADYVVGSRFTGSIGRMLPHRRLGNRLLTLGLRVVARQPITDGQSGYRALSARAAAACEIAHDYNYAQVLTLSLWGAGIDPLEVPIGYRRRTSGRSFIRYPEYFARVAPAIWREWRASRTTRRAIAAPMPAASQYAQPPSGSNNGKSSTSGPNGASGRPVTSSPPARTST
jgi:glycosyltransferase involved in cell wall biosynthesis